MANLEDYSGPLKKDLKLEDFSKEFLVKLAREWQAEFLKFEDVVFNLVKEKLGQEEADKMEVESFRRFAKIDVPRIAKLANIQPKDVVDWVKISQLLLEGLFLQPSCSFDVINRDHVKVTIHKCIILDYFEKHDPSRIKPICEGLEVPMFTEYGQVALPDFKAVCLKLPPRKSPDETPCVWEWVRSK